MLFEKYAEDYARYRPEYPRDLLASLIKSINLNYNSRILDLACGTGKLGRQNHNLTKAATYGLDHSFIMLSYCSSLKTVCAKAENIPFKPIVYDIVVAGQAFHWFDFNRALSEILRILKPGGGLVIVWYRRKRPLDSHRVKLDELVKKYNPGYNPGFMDYDWMKTLSNHGGFDWLQSYSIDHELKYALADYLKLQRSKSYIGDAMSPDLISKYFKKAEKILLGYFPDGEIVEQMTYQYVSAVKA